jgi:hypothetical protein
MLPMAVLTSIVSSQQIPQGSWSYHPQEPTCPWGYDDDTSGSAYFWECGVNCEAGQYWVDIKCDCACKLKGLDKFVTQVQTTPPLVDVAVSASAMRPASASAPQGKLITAGGSVKTVPHASQEKEQVGMSAAMVLLVVALGVVCVAVVICVSCVFVFQPKVSRVAPERDPECPTKGFPEGDLKVAVVAGLPGFDWELSSGCSRATKGTLSTMSTKKTRAPSEATDTISDTSRNTAQTLHSRSPRCFHRHKDTPQAGINIPRNALAIEAWEEQAHIPCNALAIPSRSRTLPGIKRARSASPRPNAHIPSASIIVAGVRGSAAQRASSADVVAQQNHCKRAPKLVKGLAKHSNLRGAEDAHGLQ